MTYVIPAVPQTLRGRGRARPTAFRCTAFTASAATTRRTPAKWVTIRIANRRFLFQKPADTIVAEGGEFPYPSASSSVHYEMELVVALAKGGDNIPAEQALDCVFGYGVGLDMTRRDLQNASKDMGRPWESGKAFEYSAPCSRIYPVNQVGHPSTGSIWLTVNGETKQEADLADMIWDVPHIIAYLLRAVHLAAG